MAIGVRASEPRSVRSEPAMHAVSTSRRETRNPMLYMAFDFASNATAANIGPNLLRLEQILTRSIGGYMPPKPIPQRMIMTLGLAKAETIATAAIAKARELNAEISVAVCDADGRLILMKRMDGVFSEANRGSIGKALASASSARPSGEAETLDNLSHKIRTVIGEGAPILKRPGGLPIFCAGVLEGACGVAGAIREQEDEECARAGLAALKRAR